MTQFAAYAGPSVWGPWQTVGSHLGVVTYKITASPVGDTVIRCRVQYFKSETEQVIEEWGDEVTITSGNCIANIEVSFMGIPFGSAIDGTINP